MNDRKYTESVLRSLLGVKGYIEDVAKWMIRLAKLSEDATVECRYSNVVLHARSTSTVADIRRYFEGECRKRSRPKLRLV